VINAGWAIGRVHGGCSAAVRAIEPGRICGIFEMRPSGLLSARLVVQRAMAEASFSACEISTHFGHVSNLNSSSRSSIKNE